MSVEELEQGGAMATFGEEEADEGDEGRRRMGRGGAEGRGR